MGARSWSCSSALFLDLEDGKDPLAKSQAMLKMLAKKEKRAYLKARAPAASELKELQKAMDSIKKGDVASLSKGYRRSFEFALNLPERDENDVKSEKEIRVLSRQAAFLPEHLTAAHVRIAQERSHLV